jgi:hypothetical protein
MTTEIDTNYKWPAKGDRLLRAENNWRKAITFDEHEIARHAHIWGGYIRAGAALIDQCEGTDNPLDRHELVYPILFCYRHGLELAMKWIIGRYGRFAGISRDEPQHQHHDL